MWHPPEPVVPILILVLFLGIFLSLSPPLPKVWLHIHVAGGGQCSSRGKLVRVKNSADLVPGTSKVAQKVRKEPWKMNGYWGYGQAVMGLERW
jgi:hypothetical protein